LEYHIIKTINFEYSMTPFDIHLIIFELISVILLTLEHFFLFFLFFIIIILDCCNNFCNNYYYTIYNYFYNLELLFEFLFLLFLKVSDCRIELLILIEFSNKIQVCYNIFFSGWKTLRMFEFLLDILETSSIIKYQS